jgi:hypothetical protein
MNDNFEFFLDQVNLYREIERRRRKRFYTLTAAFFIGIICLVYFLL